MKIQNKHIIIVVLLALSVGLAYDSLSNYVNPYISVTDILADTNRYQGKSLQVIGEIVPASLQRSDDGSIGFTLTDGTAEIKVYYTGVPPQNLEQEGNEVVVIGQLSESGVLETSNLLVKCPSKYEEEGQSQGYSHIFLAAMGIAALGVAYIAFTVFWKRD
ncbi:MAG: cytochrome c maturation protein CcmE [Candidatus Bathyarchaeota archaeon]|nr:cytochrome c maturation protein CcmE [Candidatus Bathyarchaeota archaeon]